MELGRFNQNILKEIGEDWISVLIEELKKCKENPQKANNIIEKIIRFGEYGSRVAEIMAIDFINADEVYKKAIESKSWDEHRKCMEDDVYIGKKNTAKMIEHLSPEMAIKVSKEYGEDFKVNAALIKKGLDVENSIKRIIRSNSTLTCHNLLGLIEDGTLSDPKYFGLISNYIIKEGNAIHSHRMAKITGYGVESHTLKVVSKGSSKECIEFAKDVKNAPIKMLGERVAKDGTINENRDFIEIKGADKSLHLAAIERLENIAKEEKRTADEKKRIEAELDAKRTPEFILAQLDKVEYLTEKPEPAKLSKQNIDPNKMTFSEKVAFVFGAKTKEEK